MVVEENKEDPDVKRARLPTLLFAIGISCLVIGVILLFGTLFIESGSLEFYLTTLVSAIFGGLAFFFGGHGYHLLPTEERDRPTYFGSPVLFQVVIVLDHILFFLIAYNGLIIVNGLNLDYDFFVVMTILFLPYVISRTTSEWSQLRRWIWKTCKWEP
ncbi:MAG: hypothetical protein JSW11_11925 [Candidatus Heimdallarchaeota archaeon]|nr:MAG: hypothetical protein JSW11_11925 [Candidatus Heimdallarchaeota archaeon]